MKLFDNIERSNEGPKKRSDSSYYYENISARPELTLIRDELEEWFKNFPSRHKKDLLARFHSEDDGQHYSAFFELYWYTLLRKMGFDIGLHKVVNSGRSKRPDFVVYKNGKIQFYLEATVLYDSPAERASDSRKNVLYDYLDKNLSSPDFFIKIEIVSASTTSPPASKIKKHLENWLKKVHYSEITELYKSGNYDAIPSCVWEDVDWKIKFTPIPKSSQSKGKEGLRPIGMEFNGVQWIDARTPFLSALRRKAKKYGKIRKSFIIAINILSDFLHVPDEIDILDALFGQETFLVGIQTKQVKPCRKRNGFWISGKGPIYTRVSGVVVSTHLVPWTISKSVPILWHNPWAKYPMDRNLLKTSQKYLDKSDSKIKTIKNFGVNKILGLSDEWPFEE